MKEELTLYSKPNCSQCKILKRWLSIKGIDFNEVDVTQDDSSRDKIVSSGRSSLPVLEFKDEFLDIDEFEDILDIIK